jgi:hypothetical protein
MWLCDNCGKPEKFNVLCPDCEQLVCLVCGRVNCVCKNEKNMADLTDDDEAWQEGFQRKIDMKFRRVRPRGRALPSNQYLWKSVIVNGNSGAELLFAPCQIERLIVQGINMQWDSGSIESLKCTKGVVGTHLFWLVEDLRFWQPHIFMEPMHIQTGEVISLVFWNEGSNQCKFRIHFMATHFAWL